VLSSYFPPSVSELLLRYNSAGFKAYLVGGCVRDAVLGIKPVDFDVAVSATPEETKQLFADSKIIPTGIKHGTLTVIYKGVKTEVTTFRREGRYTDRRHPDVVEYTDSAAEDAARRDFTINALFYNPKEGVVDFYGGKSDLRAGILRCVGDPHKRFDEDALRILRALRFSARLGFKIEQNTADAMEGLAYLIKSLAAERVLAELKQLFAADCDSIVKAFPKAISAALGCDGKAVSLAAYEPKHRLPVFVAEYCGGREEALECIKRLKTDGVTLTAVKAAAEAVYGAGLRDKASLARAARSYGIENAEMMCAVCKNKGLFLVEDAEDYLKLLQSGRAPLQLKELNIKGTMLNVKGQALGKALEALYDYAHNNMTNDTAVLLKAAEQIQNKTEKEQRE